MNRLRLTSPKLGLQVRGTAGEHSSVKGGVYDLSNKRRLGLTEFDAVRYQERTNIGKVKAPLVKGVG